MRVLVKPTDWAVLLAALLVIIGVALMVEGSIGAGIGQIVLALVVVAAREHWLRRWPRIQEKAQQQRRARGRG